MTHRTSLNALILAASLLAGGCAAPSALTVVMVSAKLVRHELVEVRTRPGPIGVDEMLARARGEAFWPEARQVDLDFAPDSVELDAAARERLAARLESLAAEAHWEADLLAGPAGPVPAASASALLALRRAQGVEALLVPAVGLRSVRYVPGLARDRVIISLRQAGERPRA